MKDYLLTVSAYLNRKWTLSVPSFAFIFSSMHLDQRCWWIHFPGGIAMENAFVRRAACRRYVRTGRYYLSPQQRWNWDQFQTDCGEYRECKVMWVRKSYTFPGTGV